MSMYTNGFTAPEWNTIRQLLLREVQTLEIAQQAVTNPAIRQLFEDKKQEYRHLAYQINRYYLTSGRRYQPLLRINRERHR